MATISMTRMHDENDGEPMLTSPAGKASRKRKMEERDENSLGEPQDFEWETSKENVMPLKRGRNVDDLNRALRIHESFQGKTKVDQQAKEMEESVHAYKGADPLSVWVKYIKWIETNMPEDTRKKFSALEKCTRELKDHAQYKNDIRYVRLWIQYADLVSNPKDIFKYLYQNKIGEHVSLFYVGWAWVLESMANYTQAHKVYLKATQKKALPEDLLDRKYKEFQRRMSRHWLKVSHSDGSDASGEGNQRFALDDISTDGADIQRLGNSENFRRYAQVQAEKMQRANVHKPVFTVYEDPAGVEVDSMAPSADWKRLDTVRHQNKENDTAPTRWNDGPLQAREPTSHPVHTGNVVTRPEDALKVFVDDEFTSSEAHTPSLLGRGHSHTLRQRMEGSATEEEKLAQQPLKNFTAEKPVHTDAPKPPRMYKTDKSKGERFGYSVQLLVGESGKELCFEEVRARMMAAKAIKARKAAEGGSFNRFLSEQPIQRVTSRTSSDVEVRAPRLDKLPPVKPSNAQEEISALNTAAQDDMTINTRLAMEDVNSMFCSPSREEKPQVVQATVWEVPEPVERKLHFSIFEDSVDISINPNDISLRNDNVEQGQSTSFQVFSDDVKDAQPAAPRTASKSARKPLTSREDLARRSRLTNKDMIMQLETDGRSGGEAESLKTASARQSLITIDPPKRTLGAHAPPKPSSMKIKVPHTAHCKKSPLSLDPYAPTARKLMVECANVEVFAASNPQLVHWHNCKTPSLWAANQQKRRLKKPIAFQLDETVIIEAVGFLGSGAFAQVFSVKVEGLNPAPKSMAMKFEKTKSNLLWEMYVTEEIRHRTKQLSTPRYNKLLPRFYRLDIFTNGACLVMEKGSMGTLHDLVNMYKKAGRPFPETLAMHYTIQMLQAVEMIHEANILHGDIKPDNWLLVPSSRDQNSPAYCSRIPSSSGDMCLIDFGRSIDMAHYPPGTTFNGDCHVKDFQTIEMRTNRPWTTQIDSFGVCCTVYFMLYGDYMEVKKRSCPDGTQRWTICQVLKRYWQVDMWKAYFNAFLNVKSCDNQPSLASFRRQFEQFFEENPYRQEELSELLASQERLLSKPKV